MAITLEEFVIKLGLDPTDLKKGQQESVESWAKTQEETKKRATMMETDNKAVAQSYRMIRDELLGMIAVLVGAKDIGAFIGKTVTDLSSVGRLAVVMGTAAPDIIAVSNAIERLTGSMQDAKQAQQDMLGLSQTMEKWRTFGIYPGAPWMNAMSLIGANPAKGGDTPIQVLRKLAAWGQGRDPQEVFMIGSQMGFGQGLIQEALRGPKQVDLDIAQSKQLGIASDQDIKNMQNLQSAWVGLGQAMKFAAMQDISKVAPMLTAVVSGLAQLAALNPGIAGGIFAVVVAFGALNKAIISILAIRGLMALSAGGGAATAAAGAGVLGTGLTIGGILVGSALMTGAATQPADTDVAIEAAKKIKEGRAGQISDSDLAGAIAFYQEQAKGAPPQFSHGDIMMVAAMQAEQRRRGVGGPTAATPELAGTAARIRYLDTALSTIGVTGQNAEGVIAGLLAENPTLSTTARPIDPKTGRPLSSAQGLAQWLANRQGDFAKVFGHPFQGSSWDEQVKFLIWEFTHTETGAMNAVKGAGSASEAALAFIKDFERPGGAGLVGDMRRAQGYLGGEGTTVQIGEITINTRATDAKGIARDIKRELASQIPPNANGLN